MKRLKKLTPKGDTIVEVLIVLAILGISFAISTATASEGLNQSRNAQEHSQALGMLDTQVEYLRKAIKQQTDLTTLPPSFCWAYDGSTGNLNATPIANPTEYAKYPDACKSGFYTVEIALVGTPDNGYYDLAVHWDGIGSLGLQQEKIFYRVRQLTSQQSPGVGLGNESPQILVVSKRIQPTYPYPSDGSNPGPDPSPPSICNNANAYSQVNKGGTDVTLTGGWNPAQTANNISDSGATFSNNIREFSTYTATMSNFPNNFQQCDNPAVKSVQATAGVKEIDFLMRPICVQENYTYTYTYTYTYQTMTPNYITTYYYADGGRRSDLDFELVTSSYPSQFWATPTWPSNYTTAAPNYQSEHYYDAGLGSFGGHNYVAYDWIQYSQTVQDPNNPWTYGTATGTATATATAWRWNCPTS